MEITRQLLEHKPFACSVEEARRRWAVVKLLGIEAKVMDDTNWYRAKITRIDEEGECLTMCYLDVRVFSNYVLLPYVLPPYDVQIHRHGSTKPVITTYSIC